MTRQRHLPKGIGTLLALAAALLFGVTAPFAKLYLTGLPPIEASGLLYTSAGWALGAWWGLGRLLGGKDQARREAPVVRADLPYLAGAIVFGGLVGPTLLLAGLARTTGTAASLLLNLEAVFTVVLAIALGESVGRRVLLGIAAIVLGGLALAFDPSGWGRTSGMGALMIAGACASWGLDNNLIQRLSGRDPVAIVALKGLVAGPSALVIARTLGAPWPTPGEAIAAVAIGALGYGVSLVLFVLALRHAGSARTGSLFATAPFAGAITSLVVLHEQPTIAMVVAGLSMAVGTTLMLTEDHSHEHTHEALAHDHAHTHDEHHQHEHEGWEGPEPHAHPHEHTPVTHTHEHQPDLHHRHGHD